MDSPLPAASPCWRDPTLSRNPKGYCRAYWRNPASGRKYTFAHAAMLAKKLGRDIAPGHHAAHRCGNAWCINEEHLYEATPAENEADKAIAQPDRPVMFVFWERQCLPSRRSHVPTIRALYDQEGWAIKAIARHLGLPVTSVADICHRRSYREVAA